MKKIIEKIDEFEKLKKERKRLEENKTDIINMANQKLELIKMAIKPYQIILKEANIFSIEVILPQLAYDDNVFKLKIYTDEIFVFKDSGSGNYSLKVTENKQILSNSCTLPYQLFILDSNFISDWDINKTIKLIKNKIVDMLESKIIYERNKIIKYNLVIQKFDVQDSKEIIVTALETLFLLNNLYQNSGEIEIMEKIIKQINYLEEILKGGE